MATVPRLIGWSKDRQRQRADELLALVGLDPTKYRNRYPSQLSGGERQRVGVARALAADPPIMLMDEPFGAVDPIVRERLQNEFLRLQEDLAKTILFVTHDIDEAIKMGDLVAVMQAGGKLAQFAAPAEILANPASEFVARFVGADRGLKRLSLRRVGELTLGTAPTARVGDDAAAARRDALEQETEHLLVVDADDRPVGWIALEDIPREGTLTEDLPEPMSPLLNRRATLKDALSLLLDADVQAGIVVDRDGRVLGIVTVEMIAEVMREGDHVVPEEPQPPEDDLAALPEAAAEAATRRRGQRRRGGAGVNWDWIRSNIPQIVDATIDHLILTVIAVSVGFVISFGCALLIYRERRFYGPLSGISGVIYTIPSLALLAFLVPVTGLSVLTAEIALIGYTLLILIRSIVGGLDSVPRDITEAADGMGYSWRGRLFGVDLPLAVPLIIAGLRVATVTTVGLVMVTALIGEGGLGQLMLRGFNFRNTTAVYVGAIMTVLLAVSLDLVVVTIGRIATPWARRAGNVRARPWT